MLLFCGSEEEDEEEDSKMSCDEASQVTKTFLVCFS